MKINKQILLAALTLGAVTARADFTINSGGNGVGTGNVIGTPGSSGTSDYQLVLTGTSPTYIAAGGYVLNDYSGQLSSFSYDASASQINLNNAQTLAAGTYVEVVDWTLKPTATVGSQDLINFSIPVATQQGVPTGANDSDTINVEAAPEPGQIMSAGLLLGLGGMALVTRRLLKKQTT